MADREIVGGLTLRTDEEKKAFLDGYAAATQRCLTHAIKIGGEYPADYNLQRTGAWISCGVAIEDAIRGGKEPSYG